MKSNTPPNTPSDVERIKQNSRYLRGTLDESLKNPLTGAIADDDTQIIKFHGIYQQDNRDLRDERRKQKLEPHYQFMIRARIPGGVITTVQWLAMDQIAATWCSPSIRLTTRQALQFHGVLKRNLKSSMAAIHASLLDTLAACGDVNRNVMCTAVPEQSALHQEACAYARRISDHLLPATRAYHEIWLDETPLLSTEEHEPIYGALYLPRKFKSAVAIPPHNDVDIFANDMGFIAIVEQGELTGFNVTAGGGMSQTYGDSATYPRLADVLGYCPKEKVLEVAEAVVKVQRDNGDRSNRKHARLKYTIADRGVDWFISEVNRYLGWSLAPSRPFIFHSNGDLYGWQQDQTGLWNITLYIPNGRVSDQNNARLLSGLRAIAEWHKGEFRITANQNLVITGVQTANKAHIDSLLQEYGFPNVQTTSAARLHSMACVALPTCTLAMAESERYLPDFMTRLEQLLAHHQLLNQPISIRMTGCPNGCARPFLAEIALVGKAPGKYNLYLGADQRGQRLNQLYRENINEQQILSVLDELLGAYASSKKPQENFGDFIYRQGYCASESN